MLGRLVRAVQLILRKLRQFAESHIDDCAVFSDVWRLHLMHIDSFLATMRNEGVTLNLGKCCFAQHTVKFCGELIGSGSRRPDPDKVAAVGEIAIPETKNTAP